MLDRLKKIGFTCLILIGMSLPAATFLMLHATFEPTTFVEKTLMIVLGYCVLGIVQFFALFFGIIGIASIWYD
jgi:hypothetical protein